MRRLLPSSISESVTEPSPLRQRTEDELDGELEVVDRLEAEVETGGEAAGHEPRNVLVTGRRQRDRDGVAAHLIGTYAVGTEGRDSGGKRHPTGATRAGKSSNRRVPLTRASLCKLARPPPGLQPSARGQM